MAADGLAMQEARASAVMVMTYFEPNILVSAQGVFLKSLRPAQNDCHQKHMIILHFTKIIHTITKNYFECVPQKLINSSDVRDGIFQFWGLIPCLLLLWLLKSPEHQQAWYWLCRTDNMYCCPRVDFLSWV